MSENLETEVWMTQSSANHSLLAKFPVNQGNNREYHRFRATLDLGQSGKAPERLTLFAKFPGNRTGNCFRVIREFPGCIRELPAYSREGTKALRHSTAEYPIRTEEARQVVPLCGA
jgi:hypothetical protein